MRFLQQEPREPRLRHVRAIYRREPAEATDLALLGGITSRCAIQRHERHERGHRWQDDKRIESDDGILWPLINNTVASIVDRNYADHVTFLHLYAIQTA